MTWLRKKSAKGNQLHVFFNRDELKTRSCALPPAKHTSANGTHYLAPTDPDAGGTWMLANEHQIVICLLNRWHEQTAESIKHRSRGKLVASLADARSLSEVEQQLRAIDLACYRPFTLIALSQDDTLAYAWDSMRLLTESPRQPLTSSSYKFPQVRQARHDTYAQIHTATAENLTAFHSSGEPPSAYTVRMLREDAQTWSRSHLTLSSSGIEWDYLEEFPDFKTAPALHTIRLNS